MVGNSQWNTTPEGYKFWEYVHDRLNELASQPYIFYLEQKEPFIDGKFYEHGFTKPPEYQISSLSFIFKFSITKEGLDFWHYVGHRLVELGVKGV